jgi:hypothetical protein
MADSVKRNNTSDLQTAGDVQWIHCILNNMAGAGGENGNGVDILGLISEINLYEDIFSHTVSGNVLMVDTHNLISDFPIVGLETIYLAFQTPSTENLIEKALKVYKISDKHVEGNKQTYLLHFVSVEAWSDLHYSINRSFKGTPGAIVKQILEDTIKWDDFYTKSKVIPPDLNKIDTDQSNEIKLVSPQWSPFECIRYCEKMALSKTRHADYLFYESNQGFRMKSLEALLKQMPFDTVKWDHSQSAKDPKNALAKIISMSSPQINDNLSRFVNHAYGHTIFVNDLFKKQVSTKTWGWDQIRKYNEISIIEGTFPLIPKQPNFKISPDHNTGVSHISTFTYDLKVDTEFESAVTRLPVLNFLEYEKLDIEIWGRTWLEVGNTLGVIQGKPTQQKEAQLNGDDDKVIASWLITSIHHRISPNQHKMTLQLIRNSSAGEYKPM